VLKLVGVARSTYYYWKSLREKREDSKGKRRGKRSWGYCLSDTGERIKDEDVVLRIRELLNGECSCYGYKNVTAYLRWQCRIRINKKKVYRLMQENGLLKPRNRKYAHRRRVDDRKVERPLALDIR
jgi:putative transposase